MKKYLVCCIFLLIFFVANAQDRQAIIKVMGDQQSAWNRGDLDGFMQGYWKSDSLVFVGTSAPTYGWQTTLAHYKRGYPDKAAMGTLTFDILKVNLIDKTNAFVLGKWRLKREKDAPGGYYTLWFKKIKGRWVIVCDHTS